MKKGPGSAYDLDLHLEIDSEGRLRMKLYDKRDDFHFPIVNFPFVCSNIPAAPAYGVYISHLIDIPELVDPLFQVQWDRCNQRNHQT
jgi:hypothetical protein